MNNWNNSHAESVTCSLQGVMFMAGVADMVFDILAEINNNIKLVSF